MSMLFHHMNRADEIKASKFFVDDEMFPQTKDVIVTRAIPLGIEIVFGSYKTVRIDNTFFGAIVQYPNNVGAIEDYREFIENVHNAGGYVAMATDLLALTLLTQIVSESIEERGFELSSDNFFDTIVIKVDDITPFKEKAERQQINLRYLDNKHIGISLDETVTLNDLFDLINCFENDVDPVAFSVNEDDALDHIPAFAARSSSFLTHP